MRFWLAGGSVWVPQASEGSLGWMIAADPLFDYEHTHFIITMYCFYDLRTPVYDYMGTVYDYKATVL